MGRRGNGEGSIYDRVQRRVRKDGTVVEKTIWCASVSLDFGQRKVIYGNTREAVADELLKILGARKGGLPVPGVRLTTARYLDGWLEDTVKLSRKPLTYEKYRGNIQKHILPVIGKVPLSRLGPQHVQKVQARMLARGLSPATIHAIRTVLSAALSQAERWELIARNPVGLVEPPRLNDVEPRVLEAAEASALLEAARGDELEHLIALLLATGMRSAEARGLRWTDVHLAGSAPHLDVRQQVLELESLEQPQGAMRKRRRPRRLVFDTPKSSHGRRTIPLVPLAVAALQAQRARVRATGSVLVFAGDDGQPLTSKILYSNFGRIAATAGITGATPHTLRHSTGTFLLAAGVPDRVVQDILGHGSAVMTRHYQHVTPSMLSDAGARLGSFLENRVATPIATP